MRMSNEQIFGFIGLVIGLAGGLFGLWYGRKMAARKNGLDERTHTIFTKSLASGWKITLLSICILFVLVLLGVKLTAAALLGILLIAHMVGWACSILYFGLVH